MSFIAGTNEALFDVLVVKDRFGGDDLRVPKRKRS